MTDGEMTSVIAAKVEIKMRNNSLLRLEYAADVNDARHSDLRRW